MERSDELRRRAYVISMNAADASLPFLIFIVNSSFSTTGHAHRRLKLRASVGRLPDSDLQEFLVETLFKGGFVLGGSALFVLFRSLKCIIEDGIEYCESNISGEELRGAKRYVISLLPTAPLFLSPL